MDRRIAAGAVAALVLMLAATVFFYNRALAELAAGSCTDAGSGCPHEKVMETQNLVIAALVAMVAALSGAVAYAYFWRKEPEQGALHAHAPRHEQAGRMDESALGEEEKRVLSLVKGAGGSVFQSEIMKQTGFSKVKVSRILDRLESLGAVERKRRGMANLVVLK